MNPTPLKNICFARKFTIPGLSLLLGILTSADLFAVQISSNGTGGGNGNTSGTWSGGTIPGAPDTVIIAAGDEYNSLKIKNKSSGKISGTLLRYL